MSKIVERIARALGVPDLDGKLARLAPSDLQSLLLEVARARAAAVTPADLLAQLERAPLLAPSTADARVLHAFDDAALAAAPAFEAVALAPATPFGACRLLGGIDPANVLGTLRSAEVVADPTVGLALECARRRRDRAARAGRVRLCASHRCVRLQPVDAPGFSPHFALFALTTAARDAGSFTVETDALREHLAVYLRLFGELAARGFSLADPAVEISDNAIVRVLVERAGVDLGALRREVRPHLPGSGARFAAAHRLALPSDVDPDDAALAEFRGTPALARLRAVRERVFAPLARDFPGARLRFDLARLEGLGYYPGLCLRVAATAPSGMRAALADGGFVDWTQRLLSDAKERLLASGIGSELVCKLYRA